MMGKPAMCRFASCSLATIIIDTEPADLATQLGISRGDEYILLGKAAVSTDPAMQIYDLVVTPQVHEGQRIVPPPLVVTTA